MAAAGAWWKVKVLWKKMKIFFGSADDVVAAEIRAEYFRQMSDFLKFFVTKRMSGRPGVISRTGSLRRSFRVEVARPGAALKDIKASVVTDSKYAWVQEGGAAGDKTDIYPVKAKALAFAPPWGAGVTSSGAVKSKYRRVSSLWSIGTMHRIRGGLLKDLGEVTHILARKVTVPGRLEFRKTFALYVQSGTFNAGIKGATERGIEKSLRGAG